MNHEQIWVAIDKLAEMKHVSVSRLARDAGLDPTSFNKSKRVNFCGKKRWPTTESLAKVLDATGVDIMTFAKLVNGK